MRIIFLVIICLFLSFAVIFLIPNPVLDLVLSKSFSLYFDRSIKVENIKLSVHEGQLFAASSRVDAGYVLTSQLSELADCFPGLKKGDRILLKDSLWSCHIRRGAFYARLLKGFIGGTELRGGLIIKNSRFEDARFVVRTRIPAVENDSFARVAGHRFQKDRDGFRTVKIYFRNGRIALWDRSGLMLEAGWQ